MDVEKASNLLRKARDAYRTGTRSEHRPKRSGTPGTAGGRTGAQVKILYCCEYWRQYSKVPIFLKVSKRCFYFGPIGIEL